MRLCCGSLHPAVPARQQIDRGPRACRGRAGTADDLGDRPQASGTASRAGASCPKDVSRVASGMPTGWLSWSAA